jgi:hypothetical protein
MIVDLPYNFPVFLTLELLEDLPSEIADKHSTAVKAWINLCDIILHSKGIIGMLANNV